MATKKVKPVQKIAKYVFAKNLKTVNITYKVGDDCFQTHQKVIAYLLKEKIINHKK